MTTVAALESAKVAACRMLDFAYNIRFELPLSRPSDLPQSEILQCKKAFERLSRQVEEHLTDDVCDTVLKATAGQLDPIEVGDFTFATAHRAISRVTFLAGEILREDSFDYIVRAARQSLLGQGGEHSDIAARIQLEFAACTHYIGLERRTGIEMDIGIPSKFRSKPIAKKLAAKLLGQSNEDSGVKWLNSCIGDGTITCEEQSRQRFVFDIRQFPDSVHAQLLPTPTNSR